MALKLQWFTVALRAHRFCYKNPVNLFLQNILTNSKSRCILSLPGNSGCVQLGCKNLVIRSRILSAAP